MIVIFLQQFKGHFDFFTLHSFISFNGFLENTIMKTSTHLLATIIIAVLGAVLLHFIPNSITPEFTFALGAIVTGFAFLFISSCGNREYDDSRASSKTIYVGNLPYRANENDVKILFEEHGEVFAVRLMKDKRTGKRRGFGFVVMDASDADGAIDALNNSEFGDRTLKVREANDPKKSEFDELD